MNWSIDGIPDKASEAETALLYSRITFALNNYTENSHDYPINKLVIVPESSESQSNQDSKSNVQEKQAGQSKQDDKEEEIHIDCRAVKPYYTFERLILADETKDKILRAVKLMEAEKLIFDDWGLREIEPFPRTALNFYGPPGTGKTMAAHAIADFLSKKILIVSYAEIESKYHGEGPKNVKAIFKKAEDEDALLFIDEADSLLSKRLSNVTQGSEQAINSMRSQLLINLEQFKGIVIFSTNLVKNYDKAFETRVRNIQFSMPGVQEREKIWEVHLPSKMPKSDDVDPKRLAEELDDICGRDIKNAIIDAALKASMTTQVVTYEMLRQSIEDIKKSRISKMDTKENVKETNLTDKEKEDIEKKLQSVFNEDGKKVGEPGYKTVSLEGQTEDNGQ